MPADWRGGLPITYRFGPGAGRAHLKLAFNWDQKPLYDVIARLRGSTFPDQWVIRGNHHDAWVNGAEDPVSGLAAMLEEAYLYIDMPAPSFGLQLVYTDTKEPEIATIVREGDVVLMPQGYHPNVAAPGGSINFLWMMAANREREDRKYGVFNVQPEFAPK